MKKSVLFESVTENRKLLNNAEKLDRIYLDRKPQIEISQVNSFKSAFNFDISLVRSLQKSVSL